MEWAYFTMDAKQFFNEDVISSSSFSINYFSLKRSQNINEPPHDLHHMSVMNQMIFDV